MQIRSSVSYGIPTYQIKNKHHVFFLFFLKLHFSSSVSSKQRSSLFFSVPLSPNSSLHLSKLFSLYSYDCFQIHYKENEVQSCFNCLWDVPTASPRSVWDSQIRPKTTYNPPCLSILFQSNPSSWERLNDRYAPEIDPNPIDCLQREIFKLFFFFRLA